MIKKATGLEVELFIHGSMCMAYSGNCVISNYTSGRDSNRGGCAHSCRFEYSLENEKGEVNKAYFMSSKDLNGIEHLPLFLDAQIDSLKIEGRMKGNLYAATVSKSYSEAIEEWKETGKISKERVQLSQNELEKMGHRDYTDASLITPAGKDSVYSDRENSEGDYVTVGHVEATISGEYLIVEIKKAFNEGDTLELLPFRGAEISFEAESIQTLDEKEQIEENKARQLVKRFLMMVTIPPYTSSEERWFNNENGIISKSNQTLKRRG